VEQQPIVTADSEGAIPASELALRALWIAVQIVAVLYFGQPGALFFYQGF
jgi:hypothetical protein